MKERKKRKFKKEKEKKKGLRRREFVCVPKEVRVREKREEKR